jgi:hypothetical protein
MVSKLFNRPVVPSRVGGKPLKAVFAFRLLLTPS